jgi:hypothetical protein
MLKRVRRRMLQRTKRYFSTSNFVWVLCLYFSLSGLESQFISTLFAFILPSAQVIPPLDKHSPFKRPYT